MNSLIPVEAVFHDRMKLEPPVQIFMTSWRMTTFQRHDTMVTILDPSTPDVWDFLNAFTSVELLQFFHTVVFIISWVSAIAMKSGVHLV